jgi:hypothetical protein
VFLTSVRRLDASSREGQRAARLPSRGRATISGVALGGGLALLNTAPDWSGASWAHELGTLVAGTRPEHPNFDGWPWQEFVRTADGFAEPRELRVTTYGPGDPEGVLAHMASVSWIAGLPATQGPSFSRACAQSSRPARPQNDSSCTSRSA